MGAESGYILREALPSSGSASTWRGTRRSDGRAVILKILPADHRPQDAERLKREYAIGKRIELDSVVKTLGLDRVEGAPALVTEDFGAISLRQHLAGNPQGPEAFLKVALPITAALADLHRCRVVHRDLKPENILMNPVSGEMKLCDLGLASPLPCPRPTGRSAWIIEGSLPYMSPEQTGRMNRDVDPRSDLYSLGIVFFEMLAGRLPFQAADPLEWMHCHLAKSPPSPLEAAPFLPPQLSAIVLKLLEKDPADRYQTAQGLVHDLGTCLDQWATAGRIESFILGGRDVPDRLQWPQRLFGRERDLAALVAAFDRVADSGAPELVLVRGFSGIGKSSLVRELQRHIAQRQGFFAEGKFDQYRRDIPYATLAQAFSGLMSGILAESEDRITAWKGKLRAALGSHGRLLTELIPAVESLIGPQEPVPALAPAEARNRFKLAFRNFIGVFAQTEHPFTLFLDDLQWADTASLELLHDLSPASGEIHLLLVGAYRDNEVGPTHPLLAMLDRARKAGSRISEVVLEPLSPVDLSRLLADMLRRDSAGIEPFADLILEKTGGNPFFLRQFLATLEEEHLLNFDGETGKWTPDLPGIRAKGFTDNVIEFLIGKLLQLSEGTLDAMKNLACLGVGAREEILAAAMGEGSEGMEALEEEAAEAGMIQRVGGTFAFVHDRVQEAVYSLIPPGDRAALHLRIGRSLLSRLEGKAIEDEVFTLVNQFNPGAALVADPAERKTLWHLNRMAGGKAKASAAYAAARDFLAWAQTLQEEDAWAARYEEIFGLHLDLLECEFLAGNFETAKGLSGRLLERARHDVDRARVFSLSMRLHQLSGGYEEAIQAGREALELFGVGFPETDQDFQAAVEKETRDIPGNMRGRSIGDLLEAPEAADQVTRIVLGLLVDMTPCVAVVRPGSKLFLLLVLKAVNLSLKHGNIGKSAYTYLIYGRILITEFRDVEAGLAFAEMALCLNEKFKDTPLRGTLLFFKGVYLNNWRMPIRASIPVLEEAIATCVESGNYVYAGFSVFFLLTHVMEQAASLEEVYLATEKYLGFAHQIHNDVLHQALLLYRQAAAGYRDPEKGPEAMGCGMVEADRFALLAKARFAPSIAGYHILKQGLFFLYGRHAEAAEAGVSAAKVLANGGVAQASHCFHHALTILAQWREAMEGKGAAEERGKAPEALNAPMNMLNHLAASCPQNHAHRHSLVRAELAGIEGRHVEAELEYEQAIRSARENGFVRNLALALELAGKYQMRHGLETIGFAYLREARQTYLGWGANAKVRELDRLHPELRPQLSLAQTLTQSVGTAEIDVLSVIRASQAISGEILLDKLLERLGRVLAEYAGARKMAILLHRGGELTVGVESALDDSGALQATIPSPPTPLAASSLPAAIVKYVVRTRKSLLLDDAMADARFSREEYVLRNRSRSVLCLPILRQSELVAVAYLENSLTAGAFTPDRLEILEVLAAQAAVSLENARLYADLKRESEERLKTEGQLNQAQKMEALGSLVGGISHDFNNLLSVINGFASMAQGKLEPGHAARNLVQEVLEAGTRAAGLTRQLLAYSRKQVMETKLWHLNTIVAGLEKMLLRLIEENVRLVISPAAENDLVEVDRGQVEQVIMNLIVNARDAMPEGGALSVETSNVHLDDAYAAAHGGVTPGDYVTLAVTDTGTGMPAEVQARIFEPFFTTKEPGKGTGLGMSVVFGIVKQSGGNIDIQSVIGKGTVFRIHFPRFGSGQEAGAEEVEPGRPESFRGNEGILVVEDDEQVGRFIAQGLRDLGYRVFPAASGREALDVMEKNSREIRILVTDLVMPNLGGRQLAKALESVHPGIPVLYTSGYPEAMESGDRFLPKPFTAQELAKRLRTLLDARGTPSTAG